MEQRADADYDPQIARLPHPYRIMAAFDRVAEQAGHRLNGDDFYTLVLGRPTYDKLIASLRRHPFNKFVIEEMLREPSFAQLVHDSMGAAGATYEGNVWWLLDYLRWRTQGRHFFQTTDALEGMLHDTDIAKDIPAYWVRSPYPIQFVEFGESRASPLTMYHAVSGEHLCEGCYVLSATVPDGLPEAGQRIIEFVFTGSPLGKANNTDDCTSSITLVVPDEQATMLEVLEYSLRKNPARNTLDTEQDRRVRPAIYHAAKILLYLNSEKVVKSPLRERSEIEERLRRVKGGGKSAKLQRQLPRAYDRIVVGPKAPPATAAPASGTGAARAPHFRRGHFRHQRHGEGFKLVRLIWIEPMLIHGESLGVEGRPYLIKEPPAP